MRLIDADAFDNELRIQQVKYDIDEKWIGYKIFDAIRIDLNHRPTIDAAFVKHGRWEGDEICDAYDIAGVKTWAAKRKCSACGFVHNFIEAHICYVFCPNCGAKMDLE